MTKQEEVVERLSLFNNLGFTKKQWDIILKGCGCPKSPYFWRALKQNNLIKDSRLYTLVDMDIHSYAVILEQYSTENSASVKKAYAKAKARKQVQERMKSVRSTNFYIIGGVLTTEVPQRD